jgi:hypothetical protein
MAAKSVPLPPVPQVGVSFLPPTVAGLVLDVHRRDQRVGRVSLGDVLPGLIEFRGRPVVVVPQAVVVVVGAAPAAEQHVAVRDDDQPGAGQRRHAGVIDLHGGRPVQVGIRGKELV